MALKSYERLCRCGCGQIIDLKHSEYLIKENNHRNSYYANKYHLPRGQRDIVDWMLENGFLKYHPEELPVNGNIGS